MKMVGKATHSILLFVEHEGRDSPPGVSTVTGLALNSNSGAAPTVLILGAGDSASGHWHDEIVMVRWR